MLKLRTIYDSLNDEVKSELQASARKYDSAKRLKYLLMSKSLWSDLTVQEVSDLLTYSNLSSYRMSPYSFLFGDNIITK